MSAIFFLAIDVPIAHAQGPLSDGADKFAAIARLVFDVLQGRSTIGADALFAQSKQALADLINSPQADFVFLDFGNPNLPFNQFAATLARNLLLLTPIYALAYLGILVFGIWKEKSIPNPLLYLALVAGVMFFLAAFAGITQGIGELGRVIAVSIGGAGNAMFLRGALLDTTIRILVTLQKNGGVLAVIVLLVAMVETVVISIQLVYRGLAMALWRFIGVLLIPLSVLLEGGSPKTAGKVIAGFFEAWLDVVGKITLLLIVLSIASADAFANLVWLILPAGLLIVVSSWVFFKPAFTMIRDAIARVWSNIAPAEADESAQISSSAEAARSREIDEQRKKLIEE